MKVTRRQSLLALAAATAGAVLRVPSLGRLRLLWGAASHAENGNDPGTRRAPSRRVEPDPHAVKRRG